jgi:dephospho-CoA kinase
MIAIDAPLLFESETDYLCDYKISLIADKDLKVRRICKRDNIEEDVANQRLNIQQTDEYYIDRSDFVIRNNENENLEEKVEDLLNKIKERGMTSES